MAKRTNRVAWGLAVALSTSLLVGVGGLAAYGRQTGAFTVRWRPLADWRYWWIGKGQMWCTGCGPKGSTSTLVGHDYSLGFIVFEVPYRGPNVVFRNGVPLASTRSDTGR